MTAKDLQKKYVERCNDLLEAADVDFQRLKMDLASGKLKGKPGEYADDKETSAIVQSIKTQNKGLFHSLAAFVNQAKRLEDTVAKKPDTSKMKTAEREQADKNYAELVEGEKKSLGEDAKYLEKEIDGYEKNVRSSWIDDRYGDFSASALTWINAMRKLDEELDKFLSEQLKRAAKPPKPPVVTPSKFYAEFSKYCKSNKEKEDGIIAKELKKIDDNDEFDRITPLCKRASLEIEKIIKLNKRNPDKKDFVGDLEKLLDNIDKYDNHQFMLSRMRG